LAALGRLIGLGMRSLLGSAAFVGSCSLGTGTLAFLRRCDLGTCNKSGDKNLLIMRLLVCLSERTRGNARLARPFLEPV